MSVSRVALLLALVSSASAWESGPMPDFAPIGAVHSHQRGRELAATLFKELDRLLGPGHLVETWDPCLGKGAHCLGSGADAGLVWIRDYAPVVVKRRDGSLKLLRAASPSPERMAYTDVLRQRRPSLGALPLQTLRLIHEHGNLVTSGRHVFVSDRLVDENTHYDLDLPFLSEAGWRRRSQAAVLRIFARAYEVPPEAIRIIQPMPGEPTAHVDLVLLFLDEQTAIVPSVSEDTWSPSPNPADHIRGMETAEYLDQRAAEIRALGYTVDRLPMLAPIDIGGGPFAERLVFTPANALLLNLPRGRFVLLPTLQKGPLPDELRELASAYEANWATYFSKHGWKPIRVDATGLALGEGLLRCATAVEPPQVTQQATR